MSVSATSAIQPSGMPDSLIPRLASENAETAREAFGSSSSAHLAMFAEGDDEPSFWDLLDVVNPLQHIPIVNDLYREATGDKIGVAARLAGGALFGLGPLGLAGAAFNCVLEEASGKDTGGHIIALFRDDETPSNGTALASAQAPNPGAETAPPATSASTPASSSASSSSVPSASSAKTAAAAQPLILPGLAGDDDGKTAPAPAAPKAQPLPLVSQVPATPPTQAPSQTAPQLAQAAAAQAAEAAANPNGDDAPRSLNRIGRQPRFMPVPPRTIEEATKSPPAIGSTISSSGVRSNVPVTGARPSRPIISPATAQEMAQQPVQGQAAADTSNDWFSSAMMQGLSKYERTSQTKSASGGTELQ